MQIFGTLDQVISFTRERAAAQNFVALIWTADEVSKIAKSNDVILTPSQIDDVLLELVTLHSKGHGINLHLVNSVCRFVAGYDEEIEEI